MAAPVRADGDVAGWASAHVLPVRVQVSPKMLPGRRPPNRTSCCFDG